MLGWWAVCDALDTLDSTMVLTVCANGLECGVVQHHWALITQDKVRIRTSDSESAPVQVLSAEGSIGVVSSASLVV